MKIEMRKTGVDVVGDIPWGSHFCLFYETQADLLDTLVPYCKAGLESQEFCLWVVAAPVTEEAAAHALKQAIPDFDRHLAERSIEIVAARDWYLQDGMFDLNRVIGGWNEKLARASARGYAGVRVTGDTAWLQKKDWRNFCEYEESLNQAVADQRLAVLCTYPLASCGAAEILDVVRTHQFAVTKWRGMWDVIETAGHKQAKAEIKRLNDDLEQRVLERTSQLTAVNDELRKEVLQRQRAEEALRESEKTLRLIVDRIPGLVCTMTAAGDLESANQRILDYTGKSFEELQDWHPLTHPDDLGPLRARWMRSIETGQPYEIEHRILRADGAYRWFQVHGLPLLDTEGRIVRWYLLLTDIDERKKAEDKLQRSEAFLAEGQSISHAGSFGWSVSTGHIVWSSETFRIFEFDPAIQPTVELMLQRTHPEDRAFVQETVDQAARERKAFDFEHRLLIPDGPVKYIRVVGHPSTNHESGDFEFVGAVTDVTERKRAEALRDGESRILEMIARDAPLEEILENLVRVVEAQFAGLLCSVLLLDEDGQHVRHGAAPSLPKPYAEAIDGLCIGPKAGSCGTAMYRREPVVVTDILQDTLWESYREVAAPFGFRACWSTPIIAHSGKPLGSFAMYYREPRSPSPPETRALEMATHLAGIAIERKLAREERERLRQAQADLAHINRVTTMGELTASLAHEIKQPIAAAVTDTKTCLRWLGRDVPDVAEAREAAFRTVKDVTRASDIINRIGSLFKKGASQRELLDVNEVIEEMIALLRNEAGRYSIAIRSELASALPKVMADRVQLQQVFMNLMLNGLEAMKDMGALGELTIKSQRDEHGELLISVGDTGVGLPAEKVDQIFDAFFTSKPQGTGMGLPISRSIVESHGGRLWATANSGRGATFHFTLPREMGAHA